MSRSLHIRSLGDGGHLHPSGHGAAWGCDTLLLMGYGLTGGVVSSYRTDHHDPGGPRHNDTGNRQ